jgi:TnsA-like endonuclease N terminal
LIVFSSDPRCLKVSVKMRRVTGGAGGVALAACGVEVSWADPSGRLCSSELEASAGIAFEDAVPVREFLSYPGQRHFPGLWWLATTGRHIGFESWLERDHAMLLDFDREVCGLASQPFTLTWQVPAGRKVSHTPDYFARMADGSGVVVDVRPADRVKPADAAKFEATAAACERTGCWSFRLVHEPDPVLAANVRWLSGYRHPRHADQVLGPLLRQAFTEGAGLLGGVSQAADPIRGLPILFHLLWRGDLAADLRIPLGDGTWVTCGEPG